jgi:hypothetical protein
MCGGSILQGSEKLDDPREQAIAVEFASTGNGNNPMFNGRQQPSCAGTSRMTRDCHVRLCAGLGVKFPGPARPVLPGISAARGVHPLAGTRSAVRSERVAPPEPGEPKEVAIRGADRGAVLDRDRGKDGIHNQRARGLAVAHKSAQYLPVPLAWLDDAGGGLGEPGRYRASASDGDSGRSNTRGLVAILRKAQSVSQAKRTRSGPESAASSQARLFSCCSALG